MVHQQYILNEQNHIKGTKIHMRSCDTKLCRLYNKLSSTVHHNSSPHIFGSIHISLSGGRLTRVERLVVQLVRVGQVQPLDLSSP